MSSSVSAFKAIFLTPEEAAAKKVKTLQTFTIVADVKGGAEFRVEVVDELPAKGENGVLYLVPNSGSGHNIYDEYVWIESQEKFEKIGTTEIDLSQYYTKTEADGIFVAKVVGKGLSTNDYTDNDKTKLAGLENYDDTDVKAAIADLEDAVDEKQDKLTPGNGIIIQPDGTIKTDVDYAATVDYVDGSISNTLDYVVQEDQNEHNGRVAGDNLILAKIGDLSDLETEDKSSVVAAINEAAAGGGGGGGLKVYERYGDVRQAISDEELNLGDLCIQKLSNNEFAPSGEKIILVTYDAFQWDFNITSSAPAFEMTLDDDKYADCVFGMLGLPIDKDGGLTFKFDGSTSWSCNDGEWHDYVSASVLGFEYEYSERPAQNTTVTITATLKSTASLRGLKFGTYDLADFPILQVGKSSILKNNSVRQRSATVEYNESGTGSPISAAGFNSGKVTTNGSNGFAANFGVANAIGSFAEGKGVADGQYSHAEGYNTQTTQYYAHAEGTNTIASGYGSHAEGNNTVVTKNYAHVQGRHNIRDVDGVYAHIVGNGLSSAQLSNAHTLDWDGNSWYQGDIRVGGNNWDEGTPVVTGAGITAVVALTQAEYDALTTKVATTLYVIIAED